jgi:hypothetical protein
MLTPFQFAQRYWGMSVPIVNERNEITRWLPVRVGKYRLVRPGAEDSGNTYDRVTTDALGEIERVFQPFDNNKNNDATEEFKVFYQKADGAVETLTFKPTAADRLQLMNLAKRAVWGKASPEEVQIALQLVVRFGLRTAEGLQEYCDSGRIGLDCNGFVGNYLKQVLEMDVTPSDTMDVYFKKGREITSLDEIDNVSIYILGRVDPATKKLIPRQVNGQIAHIMISNPFGGLAGNTHIGQRGKKFYRRLRVVESAGGGTGLIESDYLLLSCADGVFNVFRQFKGKSLPVRIRRVFV